MTELELLDLYLQENFPSIAVESITDPELKSIWLKKANSWYSQINSTGFERALFEFRKLKKTGSDGKRTLRPHSDRATLQMACKALRLAGLLR